MHTTHRWACLFFMVTAIWVWGAPAQPAQAGEVVVARCQDRSRSKIGKRVVRMLTGALTKRGVALMGHRKYVRHAKKRKLARRAFKPATIAKLAGPLSLDGVVICKARRVGKKRFKVEIALRGADGKVRLERSYLNRKPRLARSAMDELAADIAAELGLGPEESVGDEGIALVPLAPVAAGPGDEPPPGDEPGPAPLTPPATGPGASPDKPKPEPAADTGPASADKPRPVAMLAPFKKPEPVEAKKEPTAVESPAPPRSDQPDTVVPHVRLTAGAAMHLRAGLSPRYETAPFPGISVFARAFLGAGVDLPFLKDLGVDGSYGRGFGLSYTSALRPETIDGQEQHWAAGLVYRLNFEDLAGSPIPTGPTLLIRGGYGASENTVDQVYPDLLSAAYTYTYAGLAFDLWLVRSILSVELSASYLIKAWPAESLSGDGSGLAFGLAVNAELYRGLVASVGYEQIQFVFDEDVLGETSDRFQMWYLRLGWAYR